jgi:protein phosphatase
MGGYSGGDVASRIAAETFSQGLIECSSVWPPPENSEAWLGLLSALLLRCNERILKAQLEMHNHMGTTLTVAVECKKILHVVHVGDSRLYHMEGGKLYQVTNDHSLVAELIRQGQITEEQARVHPRRNVISQALGVDWEIEIDARSLELSDDSVILLCSDGLNNMLHDSEIAEVLVNEQSTQSQVSELVNRANRRGGKDNISVIISRYRVPEEADSK